MRPAAFEGVGTTPSLKRRMASFVYEGLLLFGIGLIPGALGALFVALTGHQHPLQSDTALRLITLLIYAVYFSWFWSARGQTLPMQTWHIRVVTAKGETFRNTEFFVFAGDRVKSIDVYFGASYRGGKFVRQKEQ